MDKEVKLKVREAIQEEVYKGIVRIDSQTMREIGIRPGDIVEIEGGRKTVGIADRAYPSDVGEPVIRMDGVLRRNSKTSLGEYIKVRRAEVKEARAITIAPAQPGITIQADPVVFKAGLIGRALLKGDQVTLGGTKRRRRAAEGSPFEDIFDIFEDSFNSFLTGGGLRFLVVNTEPKQAVIITENTEITLTHKTVEALDEKIVEVTYEDVGGLTDEVKKIREMVELPLKHPELFERLGIEPPRGVLLHGAPGTGKTLLAKAVANETSAHFIHLDAPAVMCVDGSTEVLTNPDGRKTIAHLFEEAEKNGEVLVQDQVKKIILPKKEIKVFAMNNSLHIVPDKVKSLLKLKASETYSLKTKKGGNFKTSKNQPFATLTPDGTVLWKKAEDLHVGDSLALAGNIQPNQQNPPLQWLDKVNKSHFYTFLNGKDTPLTEVEDQTTITLLKYATLPKNIQSAKYISVPQEITPSFMEFFGTLLSDGWISEDNVGIASEDQELRDRYKQLFIELFVPEPERISERTQKGNGKVIVYSTALAEYLHQGFNLPKGKRPLNLPLPHWIFKCTKENIAAFLRGYYHGDGTQGWEQSDYPTPVYYSKNRETLKDIQVLLLHLGIISKIESHTNPYGPMWKVVILDNEGRELFAKFVLTTFKNSLFKKWLEDRTKTGSSETLPNLSELLFFLKTNLRIRYGKELDEGSAERYISGRDPLTFRKARYLLEQFKARFTSLQSLYLSFKDISSEQDLPVSKNKLNKIFLQLHIKEGELDKKDHHFIKEYIKGKGALTLERKQKAISIITPFFDKAFAPETEEHLHLFENLAQGHIKWDTLTHAERTGPAILYDFTMETHGNFLGGNPLTVLHNSKFVGEAEKRIREIFEEAEKNAPSIIFIDEIDAIATKREESYGEVEKRVVAQLLSTMDGLKSRGKVVVIAATNRPNSIDPALRRPGRFDREIEIGVPKQEGRLQILKIHTRMMPLTQDVDLKELSRVTHGFVGADLEVLCKEAAMVVLRRLLPEIEYKKDEPITQELLNKLQIGFNDFKEALKIVRPSALREVFIEAPTTTWEDIGGMEQVKQELKEAVEWPLKYPGIFKNLGIRAPRGVLLYGPPGTGKTLLAKAVSHESEANFILVNGPELLNKFVGESERGVRKVFEKARQASPTVIFFDEIDSIVPRRGRSLDSSVTERMVNQLLTEIDGLQELNDVIVIGATNRPDILDPALLRPGRFDRIILTPIPDQKSRLKIFHIHTKSIPLSKDVNLEILAEKTPDYVGSDIEALCREAVILALRKDKETKQITMKNFNEALKKIKPSITEDDAKRYEEIEETYLRTARGAAIRDKDLPSYMG